MTREQRSPAEESEFVRWAESELRRARLFDADSDYGGKIGEAVMRLVREFADEGHSGFSAALTASVFARLAEWKPLSPLTSDPDEWMHIDADMAGNATTWQSRRAPACFSTDGGRTYYDIDEPAGRFRRAVSRIRRQRPWTIHRTLSPDSED